MGKKGIRLNREGRPSPGKIPAVKSYAGSDRYSDTVIVELDRMDGPVSAFKKYFGFWKTAFRPGKKTKKQG